MLSVTSTVAQATAVVGFITAPLLGFPKLGSACRWIAAGATITALWLKNLQVQQKLEQAQQQLKIMQKQRKMQELVELVRQLNEATSVVRKLEFSPDKKRTERRNQEIIREIDALVQQLEESRDVARKLEFDPAMNPVLQAF
jgi:hypothetical protein